jgi:hypothetical protein
LSAGASYFFNNLPGQKTKFLKAEEMTKQIPENTPLFRGKSKKKDGPARVPKVVFPGADAGKEHGRKGVNGSQNIKRTAVSAAVLCLFVDLRIVCAAEKIIHTDIVVICQLHQCFGGGNALGIFIFGEQSLFDPGFHLYPDLGISF